MMELFSPGSVWLVGAGPGDPDLLTRKAEKLICASSIVFYDALVGPGVLDLIPVGVKRVAVGKRAGRHSKDQRTINQMLVDAAQSGERVVRLKGGDPVIFGRVTEEMAELAAHDIAFQICPGITAASAAAASAGKSLTLRGLARKLIFVTAHAKSNEPVDLDWHNLAEPGATLAIYMGKSSAEIVSRNLIAAGMAKDTPVMLVENASLENEHIFHSRIDLLPLVAKTALGDGPAIMLIGPAVARDQYVPVQMQLETMET
tara:strand:+ start:2420 stop:3196 length:777 start_codon:yes stop_codon:yes gene_type:complete